MWLARLRAPFAVLALWALYAGLRLAVQPLLGWEPASADDWMRAAQVRDLLAGQSWWDVSQYRMHPPQGFSMHWSRLVDLPLAAVTLLAGERAALALVPLLWLLPALYALRAIMLRLEFGPLAFAFGLTILPLFPLMLPVFAPFAIDHHGPQAVLGLACTALLLHDSRRAALAGGALAAAWLVISLEGLPLVAVLGGLYGLRYLWRGERALGWFLGALALVAPALSLATRPLTALTAGFCDIVLPGHLAVFGAAALIAALLPLLPGQGGWRGRLAGLALIPALCLPLAFVTLGPCATNPMAVLDPLLLRWWHGFILEGLPVWHQLPSSALVLGWTIALVLAGWRVAPRRLEMLLLAGMALATGVYALYLFRAAVLGQLLAIPFAALLLGHYLPRARAVAAVLPRMAATLAVFALATPVFAGALAKRIDPLFAPQWLQQAPANPLAVEKCDYARLAALPPVLLFAPLDAGPEIIGRSDHAVVAASYHRNQRPMREVIAAFTGSPAEARGIMAGSGADYLLWCASEGDIALYRADDPANLANALAGERVPDWLEPVAGFDTGSLRLFRLR